MKTQIILLIPVYALVLVMGISTQAFAEKHQYINSARSSTGTTYYLSADYAAQNGRYQTQGELIPESIQMNSEQPRFLQTQNWEGAAFRTSVGAELWNLVQISLGHKLIDLNRRDDEREQMEGWGLDCAVKMIFKSPIINVELGTGLLGSRLDYRHELNYAKFHGSGQFHSLELNYYLSRTISLYFHARQEREHLVRTQGDSPSDQFDTDSTLMGLGLRIWMRQSLVSSLRAAL